VEAEVVVAGAVVLALVDSVVDPGVVVIPVVALLVVPIAVPSVVAIPVVEAPALTGDLNNEQVLFHLGGPCGHYVCQ
jgi:hypothetical protein